jgi:DNA polymerase-1
MSRYVFDIETDNLLLSCTKCHIVFAYNIDTKKSQYWLEGDLGWQEVFNSAKLLIGHNIISFDILALEKLFKWKLPKSVNIHDTLIMSQVLDYKRFGNEGHSLERWGKYFGYPKIEFSDFENYSEEMLKYCERDVLLNVKVFNKLKEEASKLIINKPALKHYLKAEQAVAKWSATATLHGWPFDVKNAKILFKQMEDELNEVRAKLLPLLGSKTVAVDKKLGEVIPKKPKWTKLGTYNSHTANWFNIDPYTGQDEDRLVEGDYSRVLFEPLDLDSVHDVKVFLFRNGWIPTEYNYKKVVKYDPIRKSEQTYNEQSSPKITEDSLEFLGGNGKLYCDFLTTKSRHSILKTWLENVDANNKLHGDCFTIGTPSMRARHSIIVNVPSVDSAWGKEMRALFGCLPNWKFIGADSAGNQARGLAHYLQSKDFIDTLLNKDIHQSNADILTNTLASMKISHVVPRGVAKRILYAFLFGAAGAKLWLYIFGVSDKTKGNKLKNGFIKAVPGFKDLLDKLEKIYGETSKYSEGYIYGIAGNRIYCDSFHKLLVYLLQACEKATCSAALMLTVEELEKQNIPYIPLIFYHDEIDFMVPEEFAETAANIAKKAFKDGPKLFGVEIMDGEAKIGNNWLECH